jgi:hypothetical protein
MPVRGEFISTSSQGQSYRGLVDSVTVGGNIAKLIAKPLTSAVYYVSPQIRGQRT